MDDEHIKVAIAAKNVNVFNNVIDRHSKYLWSIASIILMNSATVEDVEECIADVFFHLWSKIDLYDSSKSNLKTYLSIITRNKAIDKLRKIYKYKEVSLDDDMISQSDIINEVIQRETDNIIKSSIYNLSEPDREIMIRRFYLDQKPSEISIALKLQIRQVENKIYKSKQYLKHILKLNDEVSL